MKLVFLFSLFVALPSLGQETPARDGVIDLRRLDLLGREIDRYRIRVECSPQSAARAPSSCQRLSVLAVTVAFRVLDRPAKLDPADANALRSSPTPITQVLGAPITIAQSRETPSGQVCGYGAGVFEKDGADQYGGSWNLIPVMYLVGADKWEHRFVVEPRFTAYRQAAEGGRATVTAVTSEKDIDRPTFTAGDLLRKYFPIGF